MINLDSVRIDRIFVPREMEDNHGVRRQYQQPVMKLSMYKRIPKPEVIDGQMIERSSLEVDDYFIDLETASKIAQNILKVRSSILGHIKEAEDKKKTKKNESAPKKSSKK